MVRTSDGGLNVTRRELTALSILLTLLGFGLGAGVRAGVIYTIFRQQHEFLIYEMCRVERHLGMVIPRDCRGNLPPGEGQ